MNVITETIDIGNGKPILLETGRLAKQADGAVLLRCGDTVILATVVASKEVRPGTDFLPLSVDYQEKFSGTGRFPGGFLKREGKLSDYEILVSRLVDRALRPLFPDDFHHDVQVNVVVFSADENNPPESLAGVAASAAVAVSGIPFNGPMGELRVAIINNQFVLNPSLSDLEHADLELIVAGKDNSVLMVEGEMNIVSEKTMLDAIKFASKGIEIICNSLRNLSQKVNKPVMAYEKRVIDENLWKEVEALCADKIQTVIEKALGKDERKKEFSAIEEDCLTKLTEGLTEEEAAQKASKIKFYYHEIHKQLTREYALNQGKRLDGRGLEDIRPIWCEVGLLPRAHGSAIFTRGETQSLSTCTLGTKEDEQEIDGALITGFKRFILHYNFPGYSTGEVKPNRAPGRREIGHGNLAERALKVVVPMDEAINPYTIRIVSDILESNGSSSMATVCAGTLALMDAGIKIKAPVSGIAMGLISDTKTGRFAVLSDILGDEDHLGDMDFKVCGTAEGITACQMDLKVTGISFETMEKALEQAKRGRIYILNEMLKTIQEPRAEYSPYAPRIEKLIIEPSDIGAVIGTGGKVVQEITKVTGAKITIEEKDNKGLVYVSATNQSSLEQALKWIRGIVEKPVIGEIYDAKVISIVDFGAFVEFLPGNQGLLHISEIDHKRFASMKDTGLKVGDTITVKLIEIDPKTGKYKLSRKALIKNTASPQNHSQSKVKNLNKK
ncbi:MAG: polyribonucleotide nucleotidyltransferase [Bacteroidia bacterium]|nr:polyribonucleotide nucleotidyltransferase [Bacteroidia bacterium]MDW8347632.1 polyribonucleotide nucleotidyltransferase [Bacteroidia bacterium]